MRIYTDFLQVCTLLHTTALLDRCILPRALPDDDDDDNRRPVWPMWLWATSQEYEMYSHQSNHCQTAAHCRVPCDTRKTEGFAKAPRNLRGKPSEGSVKDFSHVRQDARCSRRRLWPHHLPLCRLEPLCTHFVHLRHTPFFCHGILLRKKELSFFVI